MIAVVGIFIMAACLTVITEQGNQENTLGNSFTASKCCDFGFIANSMCDSCLCRIKGRTISNVNAEACYNAGGGIDWTRCSFRVRDYPQLCAQNN
jgi:hypothetical protein